MVQQIMNTVEKISMGVTPAQLILRELTSYMSRINETHTSAVASKERDLIAMQVELVAANNKLKAPKVREMEHQASR
jgi:hypothetical protein